MLCMIPPTFLLTGLSGWQRPPRLGTAEGALCYTWANLEGMCQNMDYFFLDHSVNELSIFVHRG